MLSRAEESALSLQDCWRTLACNRAFITLNLAAASAGIAAFVQKMALAAAAGVLGSVYARIGYAPGEPQTVVTLAGIRWLMLGAPALGPAAAALADAMRRGSMRASSRG